MRNLYLINYHFHKQVTEGESVEAYYFDEFASTLYIITYSKSLFVLALDKGDYSVIKDTREIPLDSTINKNEVILDFRYIQEIEAVVLVCESGEVFKIMPSSENTENVGSIEDGLYDAKWSPNEEKLVLATKAGNLLILDTEFEPKCETTIDDGDCTGNPESLPISSACVSWRGDAKFLTVHYGVLDGRKALTRDINLAVFKSVARADPEGGVVQSVSEKPVKHLQNIVAYQPSGSLIASVERVQFEEGKYRSRIVFWEKNGLRHGEFTLPAFAEGCDLKNEESDLQVLQIQWNKDSDILGLHVMYYLPRHICLNGHSDGKGEQSIILYTRSNYKWYIKRVFVAPEGKKIVNFQWSISDSFRIFVTYKSGDFEIMDLKYDYSVSGKDSNIPNEQAWTVSVDFRSLLMTPYGRAVIPPPMCRERYNSSAAVEAFYQTKNTVVTINRELMEFHELNVDTPQQLRTTRSLQIDDTGSHMERIRHFVFLQSSNNPTYYGIALFIANKQDTQYFHKILVKREKNSNNLVVAAHKILEIDLYVFAMCPSASYLRNEDPDYIVLHDRNGNTCTHLIEDDFVNPEAAEPFEYKVTAREVTQQPFVRIQEIPAEGSNFTIGLTANMRLYIDTKVVTTECTSFYYHDGFLLFTALSSGLYHHLYLYKVGEPSFQSLSLAPNPQVALPNADGPSHNVRRVERGSKIICVHKEKVVLQMPRGNLEGIAPRLLLLHKTKALVDSKDYKQAFELLRKHRLDQNLLIDINPQEFVKSAEDVVRQIEKVDYLNLLLTSIKEDSNEDVSYVLTQEEQKAAIDFITTQKLQRNKVALICESIRNALIKINKDKYVLTIMTSYVKEEALEVVLSEIIKIRDSETQDEEKEPVPPHLDPETMQKHKAPKKIASKEIIEYVCWLADANRLYEVALSTYNLDVTIMVAQQTQKDPKEYLPYIEGLKKLTDSVEMKAKINLDLKNYGRSVEELSSGNNDQRARAIQLVKEHNLYAMGLRIFAQDRKVTNEINSAFGDYVLSRKDYGLASMLYEQAENYSAALKTYKITFNIQKYLTTLKKLNLSEEDHREHLKEFHSELITQSMNSEAAEVLLNISGEENLKEVISLLAKAKNWSRLCDLTNGEPKLQEEFVHPAMKLEFNLRFNFLTESINTYTQKKQRLAVVQENKRLMPMLLGDPIHGIIDSDVASDVTDTTGGRSSRSKTARSTSSIRSNASSRSRKPKNLLDRNVKEGSVFEEEYLVGYLNKMKVTPKMKEDYEAFLRYLISFGLVEQAERLLTLLEKYTNVTNNRFKNIKQIDFEAEHPELKELYPENEDFKEIYHGEPYQSATFKYLKFHRSKKQ